MAGHALPPQPSSAGFSIIFTSSWGNPPPVANQHDLYMALSHTVRDRMMERWITTVQNYQQWDWSPPPVGFSPIRSHGLAISLMAVRLPQLLLSRIAVPVLYCQA